MTTAKVKRSQFRTFLDVAPSSTADYRLVGDGVTSAAIDYNPNVTSETYIHEDAATVIVEGYAPTMPIEATAKNGDSVFEFIDALRKAQAILEAAESNMVEVWLYETPTLGEYPAQKRRVSIAINSFGGDGGVANKINYTVNFIGDPVNGTFNPSTRVFTANP